MTTAEKRTILEAAGYVFTMPNDVNWAIEAGVKTPDGWNYDRVIIGGDTKVLHDRQTSILFEDIVDKAWQHYEDSE